VDEDGGAGEGEASGGVIDDIDLAGVLAGFELAEGHVELEGDGVATGLVEFGGLDERRFECLLAVAEKFDAGEDVGLCLVVGASGGRVDLVEEVEVLVLAEDVGQVGDELLSVVDERVISVALGHGDALGGEDDGAHFEREFAQVGDVDVGLEGAHVSGFVFADDKFEVVFAGG